MKWLKRTWLSIIRRPGKTFLLFLVVFVMANLLSGSLAIVQTSETIKQHFRKSIAPKIVMDFEEVYEKDGKVYFRELNNETLTKYLEVARELSQNEKVVDYEESVATGSIAAYTDDLGLAGQKEKIYFTTIGTNAIEPTEFVEGKVKLAGSANNRWFTQEELESDEVCIIVNQRLGSISTGAISPPMKTGLTEIGNTVTLSIVGSKYDSKLDDFIYYPYQFQAKVIGVVTSSDFLYYDCIYMPNKALLKVVNEANEYFKGIGLDERILSVKATNFTFDSIEEVEAFDTYLTSISDQLVEGTVYEATSELYRRNIGPVETLDTVARVIFVVSVIATIAILGLIIVYLISERKQEMGVYVSLGEKSKHVVYQVLCEIVLVATLSITLASGSGLYLGNKLSDYMLEIQRYVQRQQSLGALANLPVIYKPIDDGITMTSRDDVIDNFELTPNVEYFVTVYSVGEISVILSCVAPLMYLTKLKPKEIML